MKSAVDLGAFEGAWGEHLRAPVSKAMIGRYQGRPWVTSQKGNTNVSLHKRIVPVLNFVSVIAVQFSGNILIAAQERISVIPQAGYTPEDNRR